MLARLEMVDVGGPLRVSHPLGLSGSARAVAEHHRRTLIEKRPLAVLGLVADQVLVGDRTGQGITCLVAQNHPGLDSLELVGERSNEGNQVGIDEDHLVLGVVDDVNDLVGKKPQIDRVTHAPGVGGRPVQLMMSLVVPGKRADGIPNLQTQGVHCRGKLPHSNVGGSIGRSRDRPVRLDRNDLLIRVDPHRMVVKSGHQEREVVLHMWHQLSPMSLFFLGFALYVGQVSLVVERRVSRREKPRGSLGRSLNPLGVLYPVCRPAGDRTSLGLRRWPKPAAVRSEDRSPRFREVCKPFGLLAVSSFDDPEGSPLGLPTARCLGFPLASG